MPQLEPQRLPGKNDPPAPQTQPAPRVASASQPTPILPNELPAPKPRSNDRPTIQLQDNEDPVEMVRMASTAETETALKDLKDIAMGTWGVVEDRIGGRF